MFEYLFSRNIDHKPTYLDRVDDLEFLQIIRLKGAIDQSVIPVIEKRILENRHHGSVIDKNVLLDFRNVVHVDTATIAFHIIRLKEYQESHHRIGFVNIPSEFKSLLDLFKFGEMFKIYMSEDQAVAELNTI